MSAPPPVSPRRLAWRDLWSIPGVLTVSRLPMACAFPLFQASTVGFVSLYLACVLTDILDGWTARRLGQVSHTGSVLDGWLDKVVHVNAAWTLVNAELMPNWWMACWFSRELIQGPMVIWLTGRFYRGEVGPHEATVVGKVTAWLLGVAMVAVALGLRGLGEVLTPIIGLCGAWSGFGYLWRELRDLRALSRRA